MNFHLFKQAVAAQFAILAKHQLFRTAVTKDELWATYLASFPEGSNPIYKTRTEHDCQCCKQFIRAVGNVVAVINGKVTSVWDMDTSALVNRVDTVEYLIVSRAMTNLVKAHPIEDAFLHYEPKAGTEKSLQDTLDGVITWNHFFVNIPAKFVAPNADIPSKLSVIRSQREVFERGLKELTADALNTVVELIDQNALYRGAEHRHAVQTFRGLKALYDLVPEAQRSAWTWSESLLQGGSVTGFRNTSIGTLVTALSEGKELEDAVKAFEAMVAPTNYKRPTALVTKAMIEAAKTKITELGLTSALERRYATLADISVNNVLFADRSVLHRFMHDVFDDLAAATPIKPKSLDKAQELSIDAFLADVLPNAKTVEVMVEGRHTGNFVSLVAPIDATANSMFKWDNRFSWSYNGDLADSIKERVKQAGGNVTGDLCCRLAWEYTDDLDFHMHEPTGGHIYFGNRNTVSQNGGRLDVDANGGSGMMAHPVENIFYGDRRKMKPGIYTLSVNNWARRSSDGVGFEVEIECDGEMRRLTYGRAMKSGETVNVAQIQVKADRTFEIASTLSSMASTRTIWGVTTNTFQKVNALMLSPNYWDGQGVGNKHYFFMLDGCRNESTARGFFNEFLKSDLDAHRKVIEMVGAKMKTEAADNQLSGLGFSSTQRNHVLCRVTGAFTRVIKIVF